MTLCFKIALNMEDKHPLNLDKFNLCAKLLFKLSIVWNYVPAGMDLITLYELIMVSYFYFSATFSILR